MSTTPSTGPETSGVTHPAKKSNVLMWVLGGCGTLILLVIIAFVGLGMWGMHKVKEAGLDPELMKKNPGLATARMTVAMNKDLELISSDDSAGTIVGRDKKTGKTATMKFDAEKKTLGLADGNGKTGTLTVPHNGSGMQGPE